MELHGGNNLDQRTPMNDTGRQQRRQLIEQQKTTNTRTLVMGISQIGALLLIVAAVLAFAFTARSDADQALRTTTDHETRLRIEERASIRTEVMLETILEEVSTIRRALDRRE